MPVHKVLADEVDCAAVLATRCAQEHKEFEAEMLGRRRPTHALPASIVPPRSPTPNAAPCTGTCTRTPGMYPRRS